MSALTVKQKFGYGLGDTASNIVFQVVINFMIYFYTDVFGLSAAAAGTLMLVVRLFDGVTDPIMGALADRTRTRWGRYRPWLLWMCVPYGVLAVVCFITPDFDQQSKLIYAYVTYALLMAAYTAINIPYCALGGVMTADIQERASLQSWRFGLAMTGAAIVSSSTLPLVNWLGGDNEQLGFTLAMVVLSIFAILCFLGCFAMTSESSEETEKLEKSNVREDIYAMLRNSQWWIVAMATFFGLVGVVMRGGATAYYTEYFLGREDMITTLMTAGMLSGIAGAMASGVAVKKFCKVQVMKFAVLGIVVFHFALMFVPTGAFWLALTLTCIANFFHMMFIPMVFSAVADTVDYSQKRWGNGGMGMNVSGHLLALKFGIALGGALVGWMLAWHGYVAGQEQTAEALEGILRVYAGGSVLAGLCIYALLYFYRLTKGWQDRL